MEAYRLKKVDLSSGAVEAALWQNTMEESAAVQLFLTELGVLKFSNEEIDLISSNVVECVKLAVPVEKYDAMDLMDKFHVKHQEAAEKALAKVSEENAARVKAKKDTTKKGETTKETVKRVASGVTKKKTTKKPPAE